jgi:hypothetical protein
MRETALNDCGRYQNFNVCRRVGEEHTTRAGAAYQNTIVGSKDERDQFAVNALYDYPIMIPINLERNEQILRKKQRQGNEKLLF